MAKNARIGAISLARHLNLSLAEVIDAENIRKTPNHRISPKI
jgi:hypothetical protein